MSDDEFQCTQDKRDLLAGMLSVQKAEGSFLQVDISDLENTKGLRHLVLSTERCRTCTMQKFTSSQILFQFMGKGAMNEPEIKFTNRWNDYRAIQGTCKEN